MERKKFSSLGGFLNVMFEGILLRWVLVPDNYNR
jgi:hypothetical protein